MSDFEELIYNILAVAADHPDMDMVSLPPELGRLCEENGMRVTWDNPT